MCVRGTTKSTENCQQLRCWPAWPCSSSPAVETQRRSSDPEACWHKGCSECCRRDPGWSRRNVTGWRVWYIEQRLVGGFDKLVIGTWLWGICLKNKGKHMEWAAFFVHGMDRKLSVFSVVWWKTKCQDDDFFVMHSFQVEPSEIKKRIINVVCFVFNSQDHGQTEFYLYIESCRVFEQGFRWTITRQSKKNKKRYG